MNSPEPIKNTRQMVQESKQLPAISFPKFDYEQDRWATTRTQNIEEIAAHWEKAPYRVRVLADKKLSAHSMVLLRKDTFEKLITILRDLERGDAAVKSNLDAVFNTLKLVEQLAEKSAGKDSSLERAVRSLTHICGTINSVITYAAPFKTTTSAELSAEEAEALKDLEGSEK